MAEAEPDAAALATQSRRFEQWGKKLGLWLAKKGDPYQFSIQDSEGHLGIELGVFGAPETYFVDSTGIIRYKHVGDLNARNWNDSLKRVYDTMP